MSKDAHATWKIIQGDIFKRGGGLSNLLPILMVYA
jgi:hypothetical protein